MMALVKKPKNQIFLNTSKNTLMYLLFHNTLLAQFFEKKKSQFFKGEFLALFRYILRIFPVFFMKIFFLKLLQFLLVYYKSLFKNVS